MVPKNINNPNPLIKAYEPGMNPGYYTRVSKKQFNNVVDDIASYLSDKDEFAKPIKKFIDDVGGIAEDYVMVDRNMMTLITKLNEPKTPGMFAKMLDWVNEGFKKLKLFTLSFHARNLVGNYSNILLSGMSQKEIVDFSANMPKYWELAFKGDKLLTRVALGEVLQGSEAEMYKLYESFVKDGFLHASYGINELEKVLERTQGTGKTIDKMFGISAAGNEFVDRMYRIGLYDFARNNPALYVKNGFSTPAEYVRYVLFDPNDLTGFEKNVMRRVIPFYTFSKKNLVYQATNLMKNPESYRNLNRIISGAYDLVDTDEQDMPDYQIDNMWIPIPVMGKDGNFYTFKASLPAADINEWVENPSKRLLGSFAPLLRAPFEVATNTQIYTGLPISDFEGQKGYNMTYLNRWQEYAAAQVGIDAPVKTLVDTFTNPLNALGVAKVDMEKVARSKAYDELKKLRDLMSYYKQQGVVIPTLTDLENKTKQTRTNNVLALLRSMQ